LFEIYLYGVLNVAFSVYEGVRSDMWLTPIMPLVFLVLHLSYGLGSTVGLAQMMIMRHDAQ